MVISRTPIRISFVGGGTDIANFYRQYGGGVISTAIDKYISVRITSRQDSQIAINTPDHCETVSDTNHIQHSFDSRGDAKNRCDRRHIHHSNLRYPRARLWVGIVKRLNRRTAQRPLRLSRNRNVNGNPRAASVRD